MGSAPSADILPVSAAPATPQPLPQITFPGVSPQGTSGPQNAFFVPGAGGQAGQRGIFGAGTFQPPSMAATPPPQQPQQPAMPTQLSSAEIQQIVQALRQGGMWGMG